MLILFGVLYIISSFTDHNNFVRWAPLSPFYKGIICPGHRVGNTCVFGSESPGLSWRHTSKQTHFLPFMNILKTQLSSVMTSYKETPRRLWYNWLDNSGIYIFSLGSHFQVYILVTLIRFQSWPEGLAWICETSWSHWVTLGYIPSARHFQIMLAQCLLQMVALFIELIFVSFNSRSRHAQTSALRYWGLPFGELYTLNKPFF